MSDRDAAWSRAALAAWEVARGGVLKLEPTTETPTIVLFDATCAYRGDLRGEWERAPHNGSVTLPDRKTVPPRVTSFAAPYDNDRRAFFTMALPSVWEANKVQSDLGLETLMTAVLGHEMTHTRQLYYFAPRLAELTKRYQLPDDIDDDVVQTQFEKVPAITADIAAERDQLFAAVASPDDRA